MQRCGQHAQLLPHMAQLMKTDNLWSTCSTTIILASSMIGWSVPTPNLLKQFHWDLDSAFYWKASHYHHERWGKCKILHCNVPASPAKYLPNGHNYSPVNASKNITGWSLPFKNSKSKYFGFLCMHICKTWQTKITICQLEYTLSIARTSVKICWKHGEVKYVVKLHWDWCW